MKTDLIHTLTGTFVAHAQQAENGIEFWLARDLQHLLGYDEYLARIHDSFSGRVVVVDAEDSVNKIILAVKSIEFPPPLSAIRHHAKLLCLSHPLNFQAKSNRLIRALPTLVSRHV